MNSKQKDIYDKFVSVQRPHPDNISVKTLEPYLGQEHFKTHQSYFLPRKLLIDSINICNANCIFCGYQYRKDKNTIIPIPLIDSLTKQYSKLHPDSFVSFTPTVGDPLLDKDIFLKINLAKKNGIKRIQFYTNAILLKERLDELLESSLDNLEISLADFDETIYSKIYRSNQYQRVLEGCHLLLKKLKISKRQLPVKFNFRGSRKLNEIKSGSDYKKFIKPYITDYIFFSDTPEFDNWSGLIKQTDLLEGMKLSTESVNVYNKPCIRLFDIQLLVNGDLRLCGCRFNKTVYDDLVIGNINEKSLEEIWFSERVYELRNNFFSGNQPKICNNCSYYEAISSNEKRRLFLKNKEETFG